MTKSDKPQFAKIFGALAENYGKEFSASLPEIYFENLSKYSIDEIDKAAKYLIASSKFWPTIAHFVEAIEGSPEDRGALAWNLLVEALRKYSAWDSLEITDDPAFVYALEQVFGSWIRCGDTLPDSADPMFASLRKQYMGSYRAYDRSGRTIALPRRLAGRHEANNLQSFANWRPNMELPPQTIHILGGGTWQQGAITLDRKRGQFQIVSDRPQLGNGQ